MFTPRPADLRCECKILVRSVFAFLVLCGAVFAGENGFTFLPAMHFEFDARYFLLHKTDAMYDRYFAEINSNAGIDLLSLHDQAFVTCAILVKTGMGRQTGPIISDPRESRYSVVPALEFRNQGMTTRFGVDHSCLHDIDRDDGKTQYWNKVFIQCGSSSAVSIGRNAIDRTTWTILAGRFASDVFGLLGRELINGGNDFRNELFVSTEWTEFETTNWIMRFRWDANLLTGSEDALYHAMLFGIRFVPRRNPGFSVVADYRWADNLPIRSKDGLLEIGLRFAL